MVANSAYWVVINMYEVSMYEEWVITGIMCSHS